MSITISHSTLSLPLSLWGHLHSAYSSLMQTCRLDIRRHGICSFLSIFAISCFLCLVWRKCPCCLCCRCCWRWLMARCFQDGSLHTLPYHRVAAPRCALQNTKFLDICNVQQSWNTTDSKTVGEKESEEKNSSYWSEYRMSLITNCVQFSHFSRLFVQLAYCHLIKKWLMQTLQRDGWRRWWQLQLR